MSLISNYPIPTAFSFKQYYLLKLHRITREQNKIGQQSGHLSTSVRIYYISMINNPLSVPFFEEIDRSYRSYI